jgi:hypothetical protein
MKSLNLLAITSLLFFTFSCKTKEPQTGDQKESEQKTEEFSKKGKHKYEIKSGIVEYKTQTMGTDVTQTLYFDDYGAKETNEMLMEIAGIKSNTRSILVDGYMYNLDLTTKTGTKTKAFSANGADINFRELSEEMEKKMNLKKLGSEEYAGKNCEKFTIDYKDLNMKGTFLVWKGVPLKSEVDLSTMKTKMEAKNFQENADVPSEKFEVPAGFQITEQ